MTWNKPSYEVPDMADEDDVVVSNKGEYTKASTLVPPSNNDPLVPRKGPFLPPAALHPPLSEANVCEWVLNV